MVPFFFTPYEQAFFWTRPEDETTDFHLWTGAYRTLKAMEFTTSTTHNVKTLTVSIHDYWTEKRDSKKPEKEDFYYNEDYEVLYEDPYYSWKLLEELDENIHNTKWYGEHEWFPVKQLF